ncbi:MAG: 4-hydroxybenzoate octaprenyltransferase [Pseudomonadota bacterium]|nr:4-hydroxybenzoate octaprenyltransferase [Pseudomonadota bacterium]
MVERLRQYALLMRWNRPIGAFLLLWPALWALWIAGEGHPGWRNVLVFVGGVWVMRSAGCVINDFADRHIDPYVERTRDRPLAAGRVTAQEALALFGLLGVIAFGLVLMLNRFTILLSFGALFLAASYPFMKRFTHLPQAYLGLAFGWAVPMAFAAQTNQVPPLAWLVFIATVLWSTIYDTMYGMVDRDDDIQVGVKSMAILFGELDRHIIGMLQLTMMFALVLIGRRADLGVWYGMGLVAAAGLFVYQQWLIRHREKAACFRAFLNNNWFGAVIFAAIALDYWLSGA